MWPKLFETCEHACANACIEGKDVVDILNQKIASFYKFHIHSWKSNAQIFSQVLECSRMIFPLFFFGWEMVYLITKNSYELKISNNDEILLS